MMERRIINFLVLGMVVFSSCYYDVAETLYPAGTCNTANMSYETDIRPILQHNCYVCHSVAANNGNVTLEGYNQLTPYLSERLLGSIKQQNGFSPMPKNSSQLSSCEIAKIEQWIIDGAQNN